MIPPHVHPRVLLDSRLLLHQQLSQRISFPHRPHSSKSLTQTSTFPLSILLTGRPMLLRKLLTLAQSSNIFIPASRSASTSLLFISHPACHHLSLRAQVMSTSKIWLVYKTYR